MVARSMIALLLLLAPSTVLAQNPFDTVLVFDPVEPTDNQSVYALLAHRAGFCGLFYPEVRRVTRTGQSIRIDIATQGVDPGVSPAGRPTKCSPPVEVILPEQIELGTLEAGSYEVSVYLSEAGGSGPVTSLILQTTLEVTDAPDAVALQDGRFVATVEWTDADAATGAGRPVPRATDDSTLFTFFDRDNWELMVKVLDGCVFNDHFWVFTAAATDVGYTLRVTDTLTGAEQTYSNELGVRSPALTDTAAFPCAASPATGGSTAAFAAPPKTDGEIVASPLATEYLFLPEDPTNNDVVTLLMAHGLNNCGWSKPQIEISRNGNTLRVDLAAYPGFGGGLARHDSLKCSPAFPFLYPQRHEFGPIEPGIYDVEFYLTELGADPPITVLTHRDSLTIDHAVDEVSLQDGRFAAWIDWMDPTGRQGRARPVPGPTKDSTLFTFFDSANWEAMVKVLDGCAINDHYWVFTAAATDVAYDVTIVDTISFMRWEDSNPLGVRAPAVTDITAFPCTPASP